MCCVLFVFEDKTGRIHLCKDVQPRNLGTVTAEVTGGAARDARRRSCEATGPPIRPAATRSRRNPPPRVLVANSN
jgi:hypothetical protein